MAYLRAFFSLFPAHAGVIPMDQFFSWEMLAFPRTRGGDPKNILILQIQQGFSPHTRG